MHRPTTPPRRATFRPRRVQARGLQTVHDRPPIGRPWTRVIGPLLATVLALFLASRLIEWASGGSDGHFILRAVHAEGVEKGATVEFGGVTIGEVVDRKARRGAIEFKLALSAEAETDLVREDASWAFSGAYVLGGARHFVLKKPGVGAPARPGQSWDLEPVPLLLRWWQDLLVVFLAAATMYLTIRYRGILGTALGGLVDRLLGRG